MTLIDDVTRPNLTQMEIDALAVEFNMADAHPRQRPTASQAAILGDLGRMFSEAATMSHEEVTVRAHRAFFNALNQFSAPVGSAQIMTCYSASVATDVVARCLAESAPRVALIHPTFDNIEALLRSRGVVVHPVEESGVEVDACASATAGVDCVYLTVPNNPTGWVVDRRQLGVIAENCAARSVILVLDTSFRGFDTRFQFDCYRTLDDSGAEYVVIEDSGKLWPTAELKASFVVVSRNCRLRIREAMSDVLLAVSPLVLMLVQRLARDAEAGGFDALHALVRANRQVLRTALEDAVGVSLVSPTSRASVELLRFESPELRDEIMSSLDARGIRILPGSPFYWAQPDRGRCLARVALARETGAIQRLARELAEIFDGGRRTCTAADTPAPPLL